MNTGYYIKEQRRCRKLADQDMRRFSVHFSDVLKEYGITGSELGCLTDIRTPTIYGWLRRGNLPNLSNLYIIRRAIGCTWTELLGDDSE